MPARHRHHRHSRVSHIDSARRHLPSTAARTAPAEILAQVAFHMNPTSLATACLVNKHWLDCFFASLWKCIPGSALYTPLFLRQLPFYHHLIERLNLSVSDQLEQQNTQICSKALALSTTVLDCRSLRVVSMLHMHGGTLLEPGSSYLPSLGPTIQLQSAARILLLNNMHTLVQLDLHWLAESFQDAVVVTVPELKHLQHLSMSGWKSNYAFAGNILIKILQACTELRTLGIVENEALACKKAFCGLRQLGLQTRIRTLNLNRSHLGIEMFVNLTSCMPELQHLSLQGAAWTKRPFLVWNAELQKLMESFPRQCPLLRTMNLSGSMCSDHNKMFMGPLYDMLLPENVEAVEAGDSIVFPTTFFSRLANRAFRTLTRLNMGHPDARWDRCRYATNYHYDFVPGVLDVLQACQQLDFLDARGYPIDAHAIGTQPWAAGLQTLRICIEFETRVCQYYPGAGRIQVQKRTYIAVARGGIKGQGFSLRPAEPVVDPLQNAYYQLGRLSKLQNLVLVRSEASRQRERGHFELSMDAGLDKMRGCTRMVTLAFEPSGVHSLRQTELKWIAKHWQSLETICGYHGDLDRDMFSQPS
ncbi:hypothetical protein BG003_006756 [Podila horticola]|nr:hypothetical protein BG003_006756 [Podila horticola]